MRKLRNYDPECFFAVRCVFCCRTHLFTVSDVYRLIDLSKSHGLKALLSFTCKSCKNISHYCPFILFP